jgi:glycerate 2-kinase
MMESPPIYAVCPAAIGHPASEHALDIFEHAVNAVRADRLIDAAISLNGAILQISDRSFDLIKYRRVFVIGAGKASALMAAALQNIIGDAITDGVVVTKYSHALPTKRIRILEAGHPIPDENSVSAGHEIHDLVAQANQNDLVICLLSGGASSLMELPAAGITLEDLQTITNLLLRAGADINELNAVRACLSNLKAGGLARAIAPARAICLVISDVLGNPLNVIGSGPCFDIAVDRNAAISIIQKNGLWEAISHPVQDSLLNESPSARAISPEVTHFIIGDIRTALDAAKECAIARGLHPLILSSEVQGEARLVGKVYGGMAHDLPLSSQATGFDCIIAGGETTVTVTGNGKGGRSQELACTAALEMSGIEEVCLLAAGTDGTDGPTDAAGALVDGRTLQMAEDHGLSIDHALAENDAYPLLDKIGCLIRTGPTQTNVGDLIIAVHPK